MDPFRESVWPSEQEEQSLFELPDEQSVDSPEPSQPPGAALNPHIPANLAIPPTQELTQTCVQSDLPLIHAIDQQTSTLLCCGQIVKDLADVIKELVENCIDSNAETIEITCRDYGKEEIVVRDNGLGIHEDNFPFLAKNNCTSKLQSFDDLKSVQTLGFRGEALHAIAMLSSLEIHTRHLQSAIGTRLIFDTNGNIIRKEPVAFTRGTTVIIKQLFHNLPVRRRAFHDSPKTFYMEMIRKVRTYAVGYTGLTFRCTNDLAGRQIRDIDVKKTTNLRDNIEQVFGKQLLPMIIEFTKHKIDANLILEYGLTSDQLQFEDQITFEGFVSNRNKTSGTGSTMDRHFFYVNSRPVNYKKLSKHISNIYKLYNGSQCSFVLLHINIPGHQVDINRTPDKRTLELHIEKLLLAIIKCSLVRMYESTSASVPVGREAQLRPNNSLVLPFNYFSFDRKRALEGQVKAEPTSAEQPTPKVARTDDPVPPTNPQPLTAIQYELASCFKPQMSPEEMPANQSPDDDRPTRPVRTKKHTSVANVAPNLDQANVPRTNWTRRPQTVAETPPNQSKITDFIQSRQLFSPSDPVSWSPAAPQTPQRDQVDEAMQVDKAEKRSPPVEQKPVSKLLSMMRNVKRLNESTIKQSQSTHSSAGNATVSSTAADQFSIQASQLIIEPSSTVDQPMAEPTEVTNVEIITDRPGETPERREVQLEADVETIVANYAQNVVSLDFYRYQSDERFRAPIRRSQNEAAEDELRKELQKSAFTAMEVVGQFAKGFILAKLEADLFIIDQHASDEKFHYERLHKTSTLPSQPLVLPERLHLSNYEEALILNNLDVFERNGFKFVVDEQSEQPGQRVRLTSKPYSKNYVFGREDIEEIVGQLDEQGELAPNYRPSKVKELLAYGACHSAKRIGDTLTLKEMRAIVDNMSTLDHPWTCAHGRPTIRHLFNLKQLEDACGSTQPHG